MTVARRRQHPHDPAPAESPPPATRSMPWFGLHSVSSDGVSRICLLRQNAQGGKSAEEWVRCEPSRASGGSALINSDHRTR